MINNKFTSSILLFFGMGILQQTAHPMNEPFAEEVETIKADFMADGVQSFSALQKIIFCAAKRLDCDAIGIDSLAAEHVIATWAAYVGHAEKHEEREVAFIALFRSFMELGKKRSRAAHTQQAAMLKEQFPAYELTSREALRARAQHLPQLQQTQDAHNAPQIVATIALFKHIGTHHLADIEKIAAIYEQCQANAWLIGICVGGLILGMLGTIVPILFT